MDGVLINPLMNLDEVKAYKVYISAAYTNKIKKVKGKLNHYYEQLMLIWISILVVLFQIINSIFQKYIKLSRFLPEFLFNWPCIICMLFLHYSYLL